MQRLIKALQARKIDRVAAVYVVAAWVLVQAASIALPAFGAPGWVLRALIALAVIGLPLTLAGAWVAASHLRPGELPHTARYTDIALLSTLGVVILAIALQSVYSFFRVPAPLPQAAPAAASVSAPAQQPPDTSIAVLPFASMSGDPSNRYFSDGVSAELIARLSQDPALRVAARESSFSFEGRNTDIRTIANALHVRSVLDGNVRTEGKHVRIEAELVSDGFTIWSHSYDGELTHILDLQDQIASAISEALTHRLLAAPASGRPTSIDPEAYRQYLEGRFDLDQHTETSVLKAIILLKEVTRLAPGYADGFAALAKAENIIAINFGHREYIAPGEAAVEEAFRLDPGNVQALLAHAYFSLEQWDWLSAAADLKKARRIGGSGSEILKLQAVLFKYLNFMDRSLAAARASAALDPLNFIAWANIAGGLIAAKQYDDASAAAANALGLMPGQPDVLVEQCGAYAHSGRTDDARVIATQLAQSAGGKYADACRFEIDVATGEMTEAHKMADSLSRTADTGISGLHETIGQYYLLAGDTKTALDWFERAYDHRDLGLFAVRVDGSTPKSLFSEPRWKALWQKPQMKNWQTAHDLVAADIAKGG
jgi:adenylate cyclase